MRFMEAVRAALAPQNVSRRVGTMAVAVCIGLLAACGSSSHSGSTAANHNAYVTLPGKGVVAFLHIAGSTGAITIAAVTPQVQGASPKGLALTPSKKFLYVVNSGSDTISTFSVASDGTLTLTQVPMPAGAGADQAVIDPSGNYLLVTNNFSNTVSVYAITASSGALAEVSGSPFYANSDPSNILITPSGKFVYVSNPSIGMVTGFSFANGVLTTVPNTPTLSGAGAIGLAVDSGSKYLYVANPSALNPIVPTVGNISGFNIDPNSGALTPIPGSPFTASLGNGPTALAVDPGGRFLYAATSGTSSSIWGFSIDPSNGQLITLTGSPFSATAGGLFALIDPSGNYLYIGSATGNGVASFTYNSSTGVPTSISGSPFSTGGPPAMMVLSE